MVLQQSPWHPAEMGRFYAYAKGRGHRWEARTAGTRRIRPYRVIVEPDPIELLLQHTWFSPAH